MRKSFFLVLVLFCGLLGNAFADPAAFVTDPSDIRFTQLKDLAKFLEEDLDMGKGITKVIGNKVIDHKFRKAGIPDPSKVGLEYSIVAQEMGVDKLNASFILKGSVDTAKFLGFADKRFNKYLNDLTRQGIKYTPKFIFNTKIDGKNARVYPFALRNSQAIITYFEDYTIISTVPTNDFSLISKIIAVLSGRKKLSRRQPRSTFYMASFIPNKQERKEIENFKGKDKSFSDKVRLSYKKIKSKKLYHDEKYMAKVEKNLKRSLSDVKRFSYQVETRREKLGYAYTVNLLFKCSSKRKANALKELMLAWLAYTASKTASEQDMVSFRSNQVLSTRDTCVFSVKLGSSKSEQYQFSSLIMTLMMQDRRFTSLFKR